MKKLAFKAITFLLPFLLLFIIEIILRVFNLGESFQLFQMNGNYWTINRNICTKYFSKNDLSIPQPIEQKIAVHKSDRTYRIVCLGGSTTAGFPYTENINYPYFINKILQHKFPELEIQVINLGISAIGSSVILDLLPQIQTIDPDLVLIYFGHNEFYGALGTASVEYVSKYPILIKSLLWLRSLYFYQSLSHLANIIPDNNQDKTLMSALIGDLALPHRGEVYNITHNLFKNNLIQIVDLLKSEGIPVILSTLTCNIRDQIPLDELSGIVDSDSSAKSIAYNKYLNALNHMKNKEYLNAKECFIEAKDLDQLRFRASSDLNMIIKLVSQVYDIPLVDMDMCFFRNSVDGIPGRDLFNEHLHPNEKGYELMAKAYVDSISFMINKLRICSFKANKLSDDYVSSLYSSLDVLIGEIKIQKLLDQFPFNGKVNFTFSYYCDPIVFELAKQQVNGNIYWDEAHYKLAEYYITKDQDTDAEREYNIVINAYPNIAVPYYKLAALYENNMNWKQSIKYYEQALSLNPELSFIYAKVGIMYLNLNQPDKSVAVLNKLISSEPLLQKLTLIQKKKVHYFIGLAYSSQGDYKSAAKMLKIALSFDPDDIQIQKLLKQILNR
ncbi:MAG: tetratricopeptide repeat protein [Calditrichaceae bacterium]|nr:tetratricopeptide repeat protein [Calditrichaceae bacterium]